MTNTGKPYEKLTKRVFEAILAQQGVKTESVQHDVVVQGRSTQHQIDVLWRFTHGVEHLVLVQCKDWASKVDQGEVLKFREVLNDIPGQPRGIIVTRTGFQEGALAVAKAHGIVLYELREPTDADWKGRIRNIVVDMKLKIPEFENPQPIVDDEWCRAECARLGYGSDNEVTFPFAGDGESIVFVDENGKRIATLNQICNRLVRDLVDDADWKRLRHTFEPPAFWETGDEAFPRLRLTALDVDARIRTSRDERKIEIRGDDIVRFILVNVVDGQRTSFDNRMRPSRRE